MPKTLISHGIPKDQMALAAQLYWEAFSGKLGSVMWPEIKALKFLENVINPDFTVSAADGNGELLGLAGFKTDQGSMVGGGLNDLAQFYGWIGACWRGPVLSLLEREIEPGILLMDGICVTSSARGKGVGTALLDAIKAEAVQRNCHSVRLDVIDTNPRARVLYEREGFVAGAETDIGPLRHLFGFRRSVSLHYNVDCQ